MRSAFSALLAALIVAAPSDSTARPIANIGPVDIDFGEINVGDEMVVPVYLRNVGSAPMTWSGGAISSPDGFASVNANCPSSIAPGALCQIQVEFRPRLADGNLLSAQTVIQVNSGGRVQTVPIALRGRGVGTLVSVAPTTIDFGEQFLGQSVMVPLTITNTRDTPVRFGGGGFNTSNGFNASVGTCGATIAPSASCELHYTFTPSQLGAVSNATSLYIDFASTISIGESYPIQVRGAGVATPGLVRIAPVQIGFGKSKLGLRKEVRIRYTNIGALPLNGNGGGFSPPTSDPAFSSVYGGDVGCSGSTVPAGATCSLRVLFRPNERRAHTGSSAMTFDRGGPYQFVPISVSGDGVGTVAQVSPVDVDFGDVDLGTQTSVRVWVRNDGDLDLSGFIGGTAPAPFQTSTTCTGTVTPGNACIYTYTFQSTAWNQGAFQAQTAISFTNVTGVQPVTTVVLRARGIATLFADGFE